MSSVMHVSLCTARCFFLAGIYISLAVRTGFVTERKTRTTILAGPAASLFLHPRRVARLTDTIAALLRNFRHVFTTAVEWFRFFTWEFFTLKAKIDPFLFIARGNPAIRIFTCSLPTALTICLRKMC